jgi:hypothetical protein
LRSTLPNGRHIVVQNTLCVVHATGA